jgi:hypothetical protein
MAALTSFLKVTVLGDSKPMTSAMRKAMRELDGVERNVKKMAGNVNKAFATMGIGLGVAGLTNLAKAASDDNVAMVKLSTAIKNATGANDEAIATNEAYIQSLSNQLAITDDELRPAMQALVLATGDLGQAQALLPIAADLATSANVDLTTASKALAKAQAGNMTALFKLMPALKGVNDPLAELQKLTEGAAEAAGNSDPFKKMQVIFENMQETLGQYLLPYLEAFADWLVSNDGQEKLQMLSDGFGMIFTNLSNIISFLADNQWIVGTIGAIYALVKVWRLLNKVMKVAYTLQKANTIANLMKSAGEGPGNAWTKIGMVAAAAAAGIAAFVTIDALLGGGTDGGNITIPKQKKLVIPEPKAFKSTTVPGVDGSTDGKSGSKGVKAAESQLVKAIETVQAKLAEVRGAILAMATKFYNAVELGFGILDRGAAKVFRADRYVRELKRMKDALADFKTNLATLQKIGGAGAVPLLNQILGMAPEEGAAILRGFAASPDLFAEAIKTTQGLAVTGARVGVASSLMNGDQPVREMVSEIRLLRNDLKAGKNTYNIKGTMTAAEIVNAIRAWEKSTGKTVLVG